MKKIVSVILSIVIILSLLLVIPVVTEAYSIGDLNNDKKINAIDINLQEKVMLGIDSTKLALQMADIDGDNKVNAVDTSLLAMIFVGKYSIDTKPEEVEEISINGVDISNYVIECPIDADDCMKYAAETLQTHLMDACGLKLEIVVDAGNSYAFRLIKDVTANSDTEPGLLEKEGYHIYTYGNGITIEGGIYSGCMHGVYDFLYNYIGYRFYYLNGVASSNKMDGASRYIYETEKVDINNIDYTHYPAIDIRRINAGGLSGYSSPALASNHHLYGNMSLATKQYGIYGNNVQTCHGISSLFKEAEFNEDKAGYNYNKQPCYTNSTFTNETINRVLKVLDNKLNSGLIPGKDFCGVDVSQIDVNNFCGCRLCLKTIREDGTISGTVVKFGNTISRAVQERAEYKDKIYINVFAYYGTEKAPLTTVPDKMVSISFCFYPSGTGLRPCNGHPINDPNCEFNTYYRVEFEKWCEITENISVWYYPLTGRFLANTSIYVFNIYDDIKYLSEMGVYEIFVCNDYSNDTFDNLCTYLLQRLTWNCDLTRDEYYVMIQEALTLMYGDSGKYIWDYLCLMEEISDGTKGQNGKGCFFSYISAPMIELDLSLLKEYSETILQLWESATECADKEHEYYVRQLMISSLYLYCCVNHTSMWLNGNESDRTKYKEILDYYIANAKYYNAPIVLPMGGGSKVYVEPTVKFDYDNNPWELMLNALRNSNGGEQASDSILEGFFKWNFDYNY